MLLFSPSLGGGKVVHTFLLWSRGGWNDNTTRKWVIKNILKENSTFINGSWEKPLLSLTQSWKLHPFYTEESLVGMSHMRVSPSVGETPQHFPKGICPKMNVIARLEFELTYYSAAHRLNHYTTKTTLGSWFTCSYFDNTICYHHHHGVPLIRISLTLSRHSFSTSIASSGSFMLHLVSVVRCGR